MKLITALTLAIVIFITACGGSKIEGSYGSDQPPINGVLLTLKPNGKVVYLGAIEWNYEVDGKDVKILRPEGTLILKGRDDGSFDFPFVGNIKKMPTLK